MKSQTIFLINHYAGSPRHGMEFRPFYMAREWVRKGHQVTLIGSSFSHLRHRNPEVQADRSEEQIEGIRYVWLKGPRYQGNGLGRIRNMLAFLLGLVRFSSRFSAEKPDVVIASSTYPLDILPAWWIARKARAKLVFEVHDLWPLSPMELGGMSRWHPFILVMQWAEDFAYRTADKVVSLLPKADQYMIQRGMDRSKFIYQPNGICVPEWQDAQAKVPEPVRQAIQARKAEGHFVIGYAGGHSISNSLETLLEAAALLKDQKISIFLIGHGQQKSALVDKAKALDLGNVTFLDPVSKNEIPATLELFDALYIGFQRLPLYRFGISPNKLMDYMMAGKPIINATEAGNDLVSEAGCGTSVAAENPQAVAQAMVNLSRQTAAELAAMGLRGQRYVLEHHDYRVLADSFLTRVSCR